MASKKDPVSNKPMLSKMPLPKSDSALVIDLPDGQKLVIGKMNAGTVIEVATWRGVGRPDSRTNRMMFGMSVSEIDIDDSGESVRQDYERKDENFIETVLGSPMRLLKWLFNIQSSSTRAKKRIRKDDLLIQTSPDKVPVSPPKSNSKINIKELFSKLLSSVKRLPKIYQKKPATSKKIIDTELEDWLDSMTAKIQKPSGSETRSIPGAGTSEKKVAKNALTTKKSRQ